MRNDDDLRNRGVPSEEVMRRLLTRRQVVKGGASAAGALGMGWLLAACGGEEEAAPPPPPAETGAAPVEPAPTETVPAGGGKEIDEMSWAIVADAVSMAYYYAYDFYTNAAQTNIGEALLRFSPEGQLEPNLAEDWEQADPVTYIYRLRPGVKFHDGSEMTAEDVVFSLNLHREKDLGAGPSYLSTFHERVASVEATGPLEVAVRLSKPDAIWQYAAATNAAAVTSKAFVEANGKKTGTPEVGMIGTGPYRFVSWTQGQEIVLERFDDYWNTERALAVNRFVVKVIQDEATIVSALGTGEIDGVFSTALSGKSVQAAAGFDNVAIYRAPSYQVHYMAVNTGLKPFDDPRVRQAISHAIDKEGILQSTWGGEGEAGIKSPATPAMWTYAQEIFQEAYDALPSFDFDPEKAKALIKEAGAEGTKATILVAVPYDEEQAVAIQAAAKEIGLDIRPEKIPLGDKIAREFAGGETRDYALTNTQWGSDIPDPAGNLFVPFWSKNVVTNNTAYHNAKVDELLVKQREATDPEERARLLAEAQALIVPDQPWIVYYSPSALMILNKRLGGYQIRPLTYWDPYAGDFSGV